MIGAVGDASIQFGLCGKVVRSSIVGTSISFRIVVSQIANVLSVEQLKIRDSLKRANMLRMTFPRCASMMYFGFLISFCVKQRI